MKVPQQGDIIHLSFDPASGNEMKGDHYGLVISHSLFNRQGIAFICPISQGEASLARGLGFLVPLQGSGVHTNGSIHCHQMKALDWKMRKAVFKEKVPHFILEDVLLRINTIIEIN